MPSTRRLEFSPPPCACNGTSSNVTPRKLTLSLPPGRVTVISGDVSARTSGRPAYVVRPTVVISVPRKRKRVSGKPLLLSNPA